MLANSIIDLLNNKELANEMSQNGRSFVVSKYSREEIATKISNFAHRFIINKVS
jgi:glycosyltransferase involved in cell wall biosynthesis